MSSISEILEEELSNAVEVKSREALHRYVRLMVGSIFERSEYMTETDSIHPDIRVIAETIKEGFRRMDSRLKDLQTQMNARFVAVDKRFEDMQAQANARFVAVDKRFEDTQTQMNVRFEDVNRRFTMMFTFMTVGFTAIVTLISIFKFVIA